MSEKKETLRLLEKMMGPVEDIRARGENNIPPDLKDRIQRRLVDLPEAAGNRIRSAIETGRADTLQNTLFTESGRMQPRKTHAMRVGDSTIAKDMQEKKQKSKNTRRRPTK